MRAHALCWKRACFALELSAERVLGQGLQAIGLCECVQGGEVRGVFWVFFRSCCVESGLRRRWVGRGIRRRVTRAL